MCDQTIPLMVFYSKAGYPEVLRRIRFKTDERKTLVLPTNNFALPTQSSHRYRSVRGTDGFARHVTAGRYQSR